MTKLTIDLQNCYGIKSLKTEFDFTEKSAFAIYAPNGAMKSSLAQTFSDVAAGIKSRDRIFPQRVSTRVITDENGVDLPKEAVHVVQPYDAVFGHTEKTSTLLVNARLRTEYENLHLEIDKAKESFLKALKEQSGSKRDLEKEISTTFTKSENGFYKALIRIKDEVLAQNDAPFADVKYDRIFDEKALAVLATKDFKSAINEYVTKYNELLAKSTYFRKGTFNYFNAASIAKTLAENGFFTAKHTVNLNASEKLEISSQRQLEDLIAKEKEGITQDQGLRQKFAEIEKLLTKNASVRDFDAYLSENEHLLPSLANIEDFKENIWKSYFRARIELFKVLVERYQEVEKRKKEIEDQASKERTEWERVIELFNNRFLVPFKLTAENKMSVMLGGDPVLRLGFVFEDGAEQMQVEKDTLMQTLSTGEKKALYILNIIFEIEARRKAGEDTIFVVDDIADSFDYKNKYAILQYLKEINEEPHFKQVILTHNFDFFRTLQLRNIVAYKHCLMATKNASGLTLVPAVGIRNVFVNDWKPNFFIDPKKRIASISFIRNIIEYTKGDKDVDFATLTSLLHWKSDSAGILQSELDRIYTGVFAQQGASVDADMPVIAAIHREAETCLTAPEGTNFENKIVLSIATRLRAEQFMVIRINDPEFVAGITSNQTSKLLAKFKQKFPEHSGTGILDRVILMTPENIHLNSFMYEPILDMSDEHLRRLYIDVGALT